MNKKRVLGVLAASVIFIMALVSLAPMDGAKDTVQLPSLILSIMAALALIWAWRALIRPERYSPGIMTDSHKSQACVNDVINSGLKELLRRPPMNFDAIPLRGAFEGASVLVTGAGGTIGGELARRLSRYRPATLTLIDKSENALYYLERDLAPLALETKVVLHCTDINNAAKLNRIFSEARPAFVFHAAAHKHVPMMERNRDEAVFNNIGGTKTIADLANFYGADSFVFVSTDKAVNPTSVMGTTKRIAELYVHSLRGAGRTRNVSARLGNVLASNGSVTPLFMEQIMSGGPITITHPDMERFFITIDEAVSLILAGAVLGEDGDILTLDMGDQVNISSLAERMVRLAGLRPGVDIRTVFTGLREGEKISEELVNENERMTGASHPLVRRIILNSDASEGVGELVARAVAECFTRPEETYKRVAAWLNRAGTGLTERKVIRLSEARRTASM